MRHFPFVLLVLAAAAAGCKKDSPYAADVRAICDAPDDPQVKAVQAKMDPSQQVREMAEQASKKVQTDQGKALFKSLFGTSEPASAKAAKLAGEAASAGVSPCPMVNVWKP